MTSMIAIHRMKSRLPILVLLFVPLLSFADTWRTPDTAPSATRELVLLNWSDYIDPELIEKFERQFNAKVNEVYFETDDTRDDIMIETDGRGCDLVVVNGIQMHLYRQRGWLAPINDTAVPNLRYMDAHWQNAFAAANGYGVPYFWGTLGIAYRSDLIPEKITRWQQLFAPAETLRGKIAMNKQARDLIGMSLKALGYSANSADHEELAAAERLIMAQKPHVNRYGYVALDQNSPLVTGQIVASMMYNGDALMVQEHNPAITFVLPEEGTNLWVDYLTVTSASSNKELAMAFINFLNEPTNAAQLAQFVHYPTPNKAAEKLLPADFLGDPIIYPSPRILEKSEFYTDLTSGALRKRNTMFAQVLQ